MKHPRGVIKGWCACGRDAVVYKQNCWVCQRCLDLEAEWHRGEKRRQAIKKRDYYYSTPVEVL